MDNGPIRASPRDCAIRAVSARFADMTLVHIGLTETEESDSSFHAYLIPVLNNANLWVIQSDMPCRTQQLISVV